MARGRIRPMPEPSAMYGADRSAAGSVEASVVVGASVGAAALAVVSPVAGGGRARPSRGKRPARCDTLKGGELCLVASEQARREAADKDAGAWAVPTPQVRAEIASVRTAVIRCLMYQGNRATRRFAQSAERR